jgi:hypothetical protein
MKRGLELDEAVRVPRLIPSALVVLLLVVTGFGLLVRVPVRVPLPVVGITDSAIVVALTNRVPASFADGGAVRVSDGGDRTWREHLTPGPVRPGGPKTAVVHVDAGPGRIPASVVVTAEVGHRAILAEVLEGIKMGG